jgi:hypothetical protein
MTPKELSSEHSYSDDELREQFALVSGTKASANALIQAAVDRSMLIPPGQYVITGPTPEVGALQDHEGQHPLVSRDQHTERLCPGDRVQVYNPGPLVAGTVRGDPSEATGYVAIKWDDGSRSYAQTRLLRKIEEDTRS